MECRGFAVDAEWVAAMVAGWLGVWHSVQDRAYWGTECVPCSKRLPGVRDAFSEAFGVKNRLHRYGMSIRYRNALLRYGTVRR